MHVSALHRQAWNVEGGEVGGEVGPRRGQRSRDGALAFGVSADQDGAGLERPLRPPGGLQGEGAAHIDGSLRARAGLGPVEHGRADEEDAGRQGRCDPQARRAAQQAVEFRQAAPEVAPRGVGAQPPRLRRGGLRGCPVRLQTPARARLRLGEVGEFEPAGEIETSQQAAVAMSLELEAGALGVGLADQQPTVGESRKVHRSQRRRARQAGEGSPALPAGPLHRRLHLQLFAAGGERHGP